MITKRFLNKDDIANFEKQFIKANIEINSVFNILHDKETINKNKDLQQYHHLWNSYDCAHSGLSQVFQSILIRYSAAALQHTFGTHDFLFKGNVDHYNYILAFKDLTFIVSGKPEVLVFKDKDFINTVIEFDNEYKQLVLNYILENIDKISIHQKEMLDEIVKIGLIKNGKIDTSYN